MRGEQLYRVDKYGHPTSSVEVYYKGDELLTGIDDDVIRAIIPQGLYRPRWTGSEWIEDMSKEEIDELNKPEPKEPSEIEILKQEKEILAKSVYDLTTIVELILTGGIAE